MTYGLAVGKFYPPHEGHHMLIDTALKECQRVYVGVCFSSVESIPVEQRVAWIKDRHPKARVFTIRDDSPVNYTDETWDLFLNALIYGGKDNWEQGLTSVMRSHGLSDNYKLPTVVYSGEDYAEEFARRLWHKFREDLALIGEPPAISVRKLDRSVRPISASLFRENPEAHWGLLAPATRAGLVKRVVVCGAESSGTTTLAKSLATIYDTPVVPEYGRHYDWAMGKNHVWTPDDFRHIAKRQNEWEEDFARRSEGGLLICDTDDFATSMFALAYLGEKGENVSLELLQKAENHPADLYIITSHEGIPFEDDGTRWNSGRRSWMTEYLRSNLPGKVIVVKGSRHQRESQATVAIDKLLLRGWDLAAPIEQRKGYEQGGLVQQ